MQQQQMEEVARVLAEWNPLGPSAQNVHDLDGLMTHMDYSLKSLRDAFKHAEFKRSRRAFARRGRSRER